MVISVALIGILSLVGVQCLPDDDQANTNQDKVASLQKITSPFLWVTVQEEIDGKLVPGEGSLLIDGDVEDLKPQKSQEQRKAVPIVGGKFFVLKSKLGTKEYAITTLVYHSFRLKKTFSLPPTGVTNSLSPLKLKGSAKIEIVIDAQGKGSVKVERKERKQPKEIKIRCSSGCGLGLSPEPLFF